MKYILRVSIIILVLTVQIKSQSWNDFRSVQSGNWNDLSTWEFYDGSQWIPANQEPNYNHNVITVRNGHTVTINTNITYDQLVIETDAQVTVADGVAPSLYSGGMTVNGTWLFQGNGWNIFGSVSIAPGATFIHNSTFDISILYYNITFSPSSTMIFRGSSSLTPTINLSGESFGNVFIESISGSYSATLFNNSSSTIGGNFTVGSGVSITASGFASITFNGNIEVNGSFLNSSYTTNLNGTNKSISGSGTIQFFDIEIPLSASISLQRNITVNGLFSVYGSLNLGQHIVSGTGYFYMNSGTLTIGSPSGISSFGATGNIQVTGTRSYSPSATYVYNGSSTQQFGSGLPTNSVNVTITNSTEITLSSNMNFSSLVVNEGSTIKTGAYWFSAFPATINGTLQIEPGGGVGSTINYGGNSVLRYFGSGSFTASYNEIVNAYTVQIYGGANVIYPYSFTNTASITVDETSSLEMQGVVTNNGNIVINGTFRMNGFNFSGNNLVYEENSSLRILYAQGINSSSGFWPTSNGPADIYIQSPVTIYDARTIEGRLFVSITLNNANNLTINGAMHILSGGTINGVPIYGSYSSLIYNSGGSFTRGDEWGLTSPLTIIISGGTTLDLGLFYSPLSLGGNISIATNAAMTLYSANSQLTFSGSILNNGSFTASPNIGAHLYIGGSLTNNGTFNLSLASGVNFYLAGNLTNNGTINTNNRSIILNGASVQTLSGSLSLPFLEINNSNGVSIGSDLTIINVLTLTSGNISTGANKVIISAGATISRNIGHIVGYLQKNIPIGHPTTFFEIGDDNYYTPLEISFNSVTTSGNLTAISLVGQPTDFTYSNLNGSKRVNRKWSVSNSGTIFAYYAITMNFNAAEVDPQANTNWLHVGKYDTGWSYPVVGTRTATSTQALGVTSFGNYVLAEHNPFTITASINGNGTISPSGTIYKNYLESQTFTITPDANYHITSVVVDGVDQGVITSYTFNNIQANHTIAAYTAINTHTLTTTHNNGNIIRNPNAVSYNYGTNVELTATPNTGYHFVNWSGDASGSNNPITITMDSDKNITANFSINIYTITSSSNGNGTVSPLGVTTNNHGSNRTFTFSPDAHYHIADVLVDGVSVGTPSSYTFSNITSNHTIQVNFAQNQYTLTLNGANGSVMKNPDAATYVYGSVVTLTAVPDNINFEFSHWSGDTSGTQNPRTIFINGNKTVTANFVPYTFRILQPTNPSRNALSVLASTNITIPFSYPLNVSSVTNQTFRAIGSQSGIHTGTFSFTNSNMTIVFNPTIDFKPGEVVSVIVTPGIRSTNNDSLTNGFTYNFTVASAPATANFINQTLYTTQTGWGRGIASGDVDNDGDIDIAIVGVYSIEVAKNNGSGQFSRASVVDFGNNNGRDITLQDLNNDGFLDIAVVEYGAALMEVYWNNGNGNFSASSKVSYTVNTPEGIFAADLNNDGWLDIVTANFYALNISVFMNNKDGTFASRVDYSGMNMNSIPNDVKVADFNSDGFNDVAFINAGSSQLGIYLNTGNGTLSYSASYPSGSYPEKSAVGDIDGDGDIDVLSTQYNFNTANVMQNNGNAIFSAPTQYNLSGQVNNITLGDIDGDGDLDFGVTRISDNTGVMMFNNGSGNFGSAAVYPMGNYPTKITFADYDGDGDLDLAASNLSGFNVPIYFNQSIVNTPTIQSSAMAFPQRTTSSITLRVNKGNGARRIIIAKQGSAVDGIPIDNTTYSANSSFGVGSQIGSGNYVVYAGTDSIVTVSGLQSGITYHFAAFEFNGINNEQKYLQTAPAIGNESTLNPPSVTIIPSLVSSPTSLTFRAIVNPNGYQTNIRFAYGTSINSLSDTTSAQDIGNGNSADTVATLVTGLTTNTAYYLRALATSIAGTVTSSVISIMLDTSTFTKSNLKVWLRADAGTSTITHNAQLTTWYDVSGNGNNATQTNNSAWRPYYSVNYYNGYPAIFFNGSNSHLVLPTTTSIGIQNSDYEVFIVAGSNYPNRVDFLYSANIGEFEMHLGGAAGVRVIPRSESFFLDKWSANDYQTGQAHIFSTRISSSFGAVRVDGEDGGTNSGNNLHTSTSSNVVLGIRQGGMFPFSGAIAEMLVYNRVLSAAERTEVENYLFNKYNLSPVITTTPTIQSSAMVFPQRTTSSITVRVNKGNGARRIIIAKQGSPVDGTPVDNTTYTPNSTFSLGSQIGTGNYVVYAGTDSVVTVSGLQIGTTYHFASFEFNGANNEQKYLQTSPATGNESTLSQPPTVNIIPGLVTNPTSIRFRGIVNPNGSQTSVRFAYGTGINSLSDTTSAQDIGDGNSADTVSTLVSALTPNTAYFVRLIALSISGGTSTSSIITVMLDNSTFTKSNLKVWLRADAGTSTTIHNAQLTTWYDVSGNGNNATQTNNSAWRPYYSVNYYNSNPAIFFNGANSHLVLPTTTDIGVQNSDYEVFIVAGSNYPNRVDFLYSANVGEFEMHLGGAAGVRVIPRSESFFLDKSNPNDYQTGQAHIFSTRVSSSFGAVRVDGEDGGTISGNNLRTSTSLNIALGIRQGGAFPFSGAMAEVLIYNRLLTPTERLDVEDYLASKYSIVPLPVELTSFTSKIKSNGIELRWKTDTELNNYGFEVERKVEKANGFLSNWEKIGFVRGSGNSNSPKEYSFTDNSTKSGKVTYRLKQIDIDGRFNYSNEIEVDLIVPKEFKLHQNYPNPFNPTTKLTFTLSESSEVNLKIFNFLGEEIITLVNNEFLDAGELHLREFNANGVPSGIYFAKLQSKDKTQIIKMVLIR